MQVVKKMAIGDVQPGMCLGVDVMDAKGGRLLAKGTELTQDLLNTLRRKGVTNISVVVTAPVNLAQLEEARDKVIEQLTHVFRHVDEEPVMHRLKSILIEYRMEQYQQYDMDKD